VSRATTRLRVLTRAARMRIMHPRRRLSAALNRILIAHHLLLGDTLMLTPLIAKLRRLHPQADIAMTVPLSFVRCYSGRPYGVRLLPYDPRDPATLEAVFDEGGPAVGSGPGHHSTTGAGAGYDLAIVPGDNRFAWLALAAGARWIVAFAGDTPAWKNWPVDEPRPYPSHPAAWGDMVAGLVDGDPPPVYAPGDWPAPPAAPFARPPAPRYAVLHVGASTPLKQWPPERWRSVAETLERDGVEPVFLAGRGEEAIVDTVDPPHRWQSYAGKLALEQVWHLLAGAQALIAPDTGIAHLGRVVGVPTVTLFGPGSAVICGAGEFWRDSPYWAVTIPDFLCRDQHVLFRRRIDWVRRCGRSTDECAAPRCMQAIGMDMAMDAIRAALRRAIPTTSALSEARSP